MSDMTILLLIFGFIAVVFLLVGLLLYAVWPKSAKIKEPVSGALEITGTPPTSRKATYQSGTLTGVLFSQGYPARPVEVYCMIPTEKMPAPGQRVPVIFCGLDPDQIQVDWERIPTAAEAAAEMARQRAEEANRSHVAPVSTAPVSEEGSVW